jgi:simple sugar transport system ATP-binding protein
MEHAVAFRGICKSYGSLRANDDVTFEVAAGSVHAVIGENGAGKSTLMRMLAGAEMPDSGEILIDGAPVRLRTPRDSAIRGVGMVYQDLKVSPALTVWENVVLAFEPRRFGVIDRPAARRSVADMLGRYHMGFGVEARVAGLPLAQRQQVEILRLLYRGARILIFDEPTAILTPAEVAHLFRAIRQLTAEGRTVLFVSHKLPEILEISDRVTVMRGGRSVETADTRDLGHDQLVRLIVGRDLSALQRHARSLAGAEVLRVEGLALDADRASPTIDFSVAAGTVLGIAGVAGNGQDALFAALSGAAPVARGTITVKTGADAIRLGPQSASAEPEVRALRDHHVAVIPQDRRGAGSAAGEELWFSMLAGTFWRWRRPPLGFLDLRRAKEGAAAVIGDFAVKAAGINARPEQLSGGNLQKFIVGREMATGPRLLIAEDPTRGVDIGSARFIRQRIRDFADNGAAMVLISTDLDELLEIADEIMVLAGGVSAGRFIRADFDRERIGRAMTSRRTVGAAVPGSLQ